MWIAALWIIMGRSGPGYYLEAIVLAACGGMAALFLIISRHPITRLKVGPDGITSPFGLMRRIRWHDIEKAQYILKRPIFWYEQEWLHIQLKPGTIGVLRFPMPAKLELWLLDRIGVFVPLHALADPSGEVLASIECFMPVVQTDLAAESGTAFP